MSSWCWVCCLAAVLKKRTNLNRDPCSLVSVILGFQDDRFCCQSPIPNDCQWPASPEFLTKNLQEYGLPFVVHEREIVFLDDGSPVLIGYNQINVQELVDCLNQSKLVILFYLKHCMLIVGQTNSHFVVFDPDGGVVFLHKNAQEIETWKNYLLYGIFIV